MKIFQTVSTIPALCIFALLTCIDLFLFSFFERPCISSALCFYLIHILGPCTWLTVGAALSMLCLESFIFYGSFFATLAYLIPVTALGLSMRSWFYPAVAQRYVLLGLCLVAQLLLEIFFFHGHPSISSTIVKLCANIGVMILLSLK